MSETTEDNSPYLTPDQQLQRLSSLLAIPVLVQPASALTQEDFAAWKPLIERAALNQHTNAGEMADLVEALARATGDDLCVALALWTSGNAYLVLDQPAAAMQRFDAAAVDGDSDGSGVVSYEWLSDLDGPLGSEAIFTLPSSLLTPGAHTITARALDDEGMWSQPVTIKLTVRRVWRQHMPQVVIGR